MVIMFCWCKPSRDTTLLLQYKPHDLSFTIVFCAANKKFFQHYSSFNLKNSNLLSEKVLTYIVRLKNIFLPFVNIFQPNLTVFVTIIYYTYCNHTHKVKDTRVLNHRQYLFDFFYYSYRFYFCTIYVQLSCIKNILRLKTVTPLKHI